MIHFFTGRYDKYDWDAMALFGIQQGTAPEFIAWTKLHQFIQLDVETPVIKNVPGQHGLRKLLVLQLGDRDAENQWIFDWSCLFEEDESAVRGLLMNDSKTFLAHNAAFEYKVIKSQLGITLEDLHDTMLMSQTLNMGLDLPAGYHSLAGSLERFFGIEMDKTEQTTFTEEPLTINQIIYAAKDVMYMHDLYDVIKGLLEEWDLWVVYAKIERHVLKAYADMELNWFRFKRNDWTDIAEDLIKEANAIEVAMNKTVFADEGLVQHLKYSDSLLKLKLITDKDELRLRWSSPTQRKLVLSYLCPSLPCDLTKPKLKKYVKANEDAIPLNELDIVNKYLNRDFAYLSSMLMTHHRDWLLASGLLVLEGTLQVNWGSPQHKLYLFNYYYPNLTDTNSKSLTKLRNPVLNEFKKWSKANKKVTSYGYGFIANNVTDDDKVSPTGVKQILSTGRISHGILLQLPGNNKFRNPFLPQFDDWVFVDTDYSSAEVCIVAHASGETAFLDAVKNGQDLHMKSASLIWKDKWEEWAEPGCTHLLNGSKCECPIHNAYRKKSKAVTFGLNYGISSVGLSDDLDISRKDAGELMKRFFETFPHIEQFSKDAEVEATTPKLVEGEKKYYIVGMEPTRRIRFFHPPEHSGDLGAIGRQGKNYKIQSCNADMVKIALINLRQRIIDEDLPVRINLSVHDQIICSSRRDVAEYWKTIQEEELTYAADMFLEPGLLGADTAITEMWCK